MTRVDTYLFIRGVRLGSARLLASRTRPRDIESLDKWDAYTAAKEEVFKATDTDYAP